ncbi:hypothetical protein [Micromonospora aurantiaca]|uniref:hypothetical protein n=1 Tax=Micromonospora aurantiaca (nom. illeg.) TaxID=47850 RepID=UPI001783AD05|nr:hypothetical protein [Micromonospora aurantiaca]UFN97932.1 hypothetical protein LF814_15155 [Micromonospora aurantiaca]
MTHTRRHARQGWPKTRCWPFVARHLSAHKRPRQVRLVGALPPNAMGKVQKSRLTEV